MLVLRSRGVEVGAGVRVPACVCGGLWLLGSRLLAEPSKDSISPAWRTRMGCSLRVQTMLLHLGLQQRRQQQQQQHAADEPPVAAIATNYPSQVPMYPILSPPPLPNHILYSGTPCAPVRLHGMSSKQRKSEHTDRLGVRSEGLLQVRRVMEGAEEGGEVRISQHICQGRV